MTPARIVAGLFALVIAASQVATSRALDAPAERSTQSVRSAPRADVIRVGIATGHGGYTVQEMPLEAYVARVLAGEAARESKPAALEALAITIRTFALANRGRHRADNFDLCDQTHCQVVRASTAATERAAAATAGQLLLRDRAPASIYYTASCGGRTELPSAVWPGAEDPPFLPSQEDDACGGTPAWSAEITERDLMRALHAAGFRGDRLQLSISSRNGSGRVARLTLDGLTPNSISGQDLRVAVGRTLGWQFIKSTAFDLRKANESYRFSGHGSGHGVGLCVIGSAHLAERGTSASQILAHYFPGLAIGAIGDVEATTTSRSPAKAPAPAAALRPIPELDPVVVALPEGDEGERASVVQLARRTRDELVRTLSAAAPLTITLRFHATTDDYERSTDRAWFTSAALVNGEIHLLPLTILRDRGVLLKTIRHELVHLLADGAFAGRPLWVKEGAAAYFAGDPELPGGSPQRPAFRPEPRSACPQDRELRYPVSVGALSNAYARARACFAKQISAGRSWRDVK